MIRVLSALTVFGLVLGASAFAAPAKTKTTPQHNPAVEAQLRQQFTKYDLNKDGYLDANEIAKAYRGYDAKAAPKPSYDAKGNYIPTKTASGYQCPDQLYLLAADKDGDYKVSWEEFDAYGEAVAATSLEAQKAALARAQRNLAAQRNRAYSRYGNRHHRSVVRHHGRRF